MAFRTKPDMSAVWASLGDNTKPLDSYITNGWEAVKPPRQFFNWLDNRQDSAIAYLYQAGIVQWDAITDYEGGAGVNSYVQGSDGKVYVALADSGPNISGTGTKDPTNPSNSAFWEEAFAGKGDFDSLENRVDDLETEMGNGSGVTNPAAWRTALSVPSTTDAVLDTDFTGLNQNLASTGFQKLPGGLEIKWGSASSTVDGTEVFNFSSAFPNACFGVFTQRNGADKDLILSVSAYTASSFSIDRSNSIDGSEPFTWFAIGF